ncbi:MAG: hypothetical protein GY711_27885 [bacterium]|nr:hypothetical protein [bacterium]
MTGRNEAVTSDVAEVVPLSKSEAAAMLRQDAGGALKEAYRWMAGVTWFYRLGALAYALVTLFAILALARIEVPQRGGVQVVALTTLLSALLVMGALHILFKPFVWNVVIATLATAVAVAHFVGPNPLGLAFPASAVLAVLLWAAVIPTLRFRRLIERHKDLYILHHASIATRRSLKGRTPEERHERLLGAMHRAATRTWYASGAAVAAIILASAIGTGAVLGGLRPPELAPTLAEFEAAWNGSDLATVGGHFDERVREQQITWLDGVLDGHGWGDARPHLPVGAIREDAGETLVDYALGEITLTASWQLKDQRWSLFRLDLPVPPLEPTLAKFLDAWKASDPDAIAVFFSDDNQARMRDSIEDAALGRIWSKFPAVLDTRASDYAKGEADVTLALANGDGEVRTKWHLRGNGTWGLNELRFPKR